MAKNKNGYEPMIRDLMDKHFLRFVPNIGGAEFIHEEFGSCQVDMIGNYKRDHETLLNWLEEKGLE